MVRRIEERRYIVDRVGLLTITGLLRHIGRGVLGGPISHIDAVIQNVERTVSRRSFDTRARVHDDGIDTRTIERGIIRTHIDAYDVGS